MQNFVGGLEIFPLPLISTAILGAYQNPFLLKFRSFMGIFVNIYDILRAFLLIYIIEQLIFKEK